MELNFASSGLAHVWTQGDAVIRAVAIALLLMSLTTWVIFLLKWLDQRAHRRQARACDRFWRSASLADGVAAFGQQPGDPFRALAVEGVAVASHLGCQAGARHSWRDLGDASDWIERCLSRSLDDALQRAQSGLTVLASIASTAPFVGLFGTVWGIYHALLGIGAAGQVGIDQVAGPIGEALIMTALGLLVAIPAVLGYNALVRANKGIHHQLKRFAHDLHAHLVFGARGTSGAVSPDVLSTKNA
ncbi:MAG: biopolymer transporter [Comamonadaceae bacterium]|nr:biopolymer transporter [Comamonadaceae bacterium]